MPSEAQKRATKKWRQNNTKNICITFCRSEFDLYDWCKLKGASEVKRMLREIMNDNRKTISN